MFLAIVTIIFGLIILVWSADKFVEGSASIAHYFGISPLLIGMVIVGFGTSAPELVVSSLAAWQGNPGLALGNAYGSNITNIALILGVTALINPITVQSQVLKKELPILIVITIVAVIQLWDGQLSRVDAIILLGIFATLMAWTIYQGIKTQPTTDAFSMEIKQELNNQNQSLQGAFLWLVLGLLLLVASSRLLVWGAVQVAHSLGIDDLVIGLTIVAVGTSLPELASSVAASRKGKHDIAIGNVLGSNLFNTLAVVGIAGSIHPLQVSHDIIYRDMTVMGCLTLCLFIMGAGIHGPGRINRFEATLLIFFYFVYIAYLIASVAGINFFVSR